MTWRVEHGDCLDVLAAMEPESVDACVTDPPYGLSFMGKNWDHGVPGVPFWSAVARVLKPGAHLLAFGGSRTYHRMACAVEDAGFEVRDMIAWLHGMGFPKSLNLPGGLGTALKPAHEPIVVARKPLIGTVAANVAKHGTGALNIEAGRIPSNESWSTDGGSDYAGDGGWKDGPRQSNPSGRWPANVALDEEAARLLDQQSGECYTDSGGASRFFYCAKADSRERDAGLTHLPAGDSQCNLRQQGGLPPPEKEYRIRNHHPTVKPVALMCWLVKLVTPPGGIVLDPFTGSGTTGMAALRSGFRFLGIEREAEYVEIARARIQGDAPLLNGAAR